MVNLQRPPTTDRQQPVFLDEEDQRERVLLVVVAGGSASRGSESLKTGGSASRGSESLKTRPGSEVADSLYAIPVTSVREVMGARPVTRVPGAPATMLGLVNVRGVVVTVLDLAACLAPPASLAAARAQTPASIVLLEYGGRPVGLAVNGVRDVRPVDDVPLVRLPTARDHDGLVRGVGSAGGHVVTLLDVAALLSRHLISSAET